MVANIKIYGTEQCPYCHKAQEFLEAKGVSFQYFDVGKDEVARKEMIDQSEQMGVPVIVIGDEVIVGFNKEKMESLLK